MLYDQIDQAIEKHRGDALELLQELVRIPSLEGEEKPCQVVLERQLLSMGLDVDRWIPDDDELAAHPAFVPTGFSYAERPNVVGVYRGAGGGRSLKFNGHTDVVPIGPPELWRYGPWSGEYVDGKVYGRGSADMKGGVVSNVLCVLALQSAGIRLQGDVIVECVVDEESGGNGTLASVMRGYSADACIFTEPTGLDKLAVSNRGAQFFRITVPGEEGGIEYKHELTNPITKSFEVFHAVEAYSIMRESQVSHPLYDEIYNTKVPTGICKMIAGEWPSTIASQAILEGLNRMPAGRRYPPKIKADFKRIHPGVVGRRIAWFSPASACRSHGLACGSIRRRLTPNHPMVGTLSAGGQVGHRSQC